MHAIRNNRAWIFAAVSVAAAVVVLILLIIELADDDAGDVEGPVIERTTPWRELKSLPGLGTIQYSCGFPGRLTATRFLVPRPGQAERIKVQVGNRVLAVDAMPSARVAIPYETSGSYIWEIRTKQDPPSRARIDVAFPPAESAADRRRCPEPTFIVPIFDIPSRGGDGSSQQGTDR